MIPFTEHLTATFALLAHEGEVRWFAKRKDGLKLGGVKRSAEDLTRLRATSTRGADCYVQLNPSLGFRGTRAGALDVTHFRGFLLDLDPPPGVIPPVVDPPYWAPYLARAVKHLQWELGLPSLQPTIVDSGRGVQGWVLGPLEPLSHEDAIMVRRAVSGMVKRMVLPPGMVADPRVCDVSRVARLPGTVNQKTGREAGVVELGWPVKGLLDALRTVDPGEPELEEVEALPESVDSYTDVWLRLTASAQAFITRGWTYPGRHSLLWHTADLLRREGLTRAAAERALWLGAVACRPKLNRDDVRYALHRAFDERK